MRKTFHHSILTLSAAFLSACAAPAPTQMAAVQPAPAAKPAAPSAPAASANPEAQPDPDQNTLSQSIQDNLTGLALETPADRERIERDARELANSHKSKGSSARRQHAQACQSDEPRDAYEAVFCRLWLEAAGVHHSHSHHATRLSSTRSGRKRLQAIQKGIASGQIEALATVTDSELHEALKKSPAAIKLRPLIENALDNKKCVSSTLLTGLGQRTEEHFPDPDYRDLAEALYARSAECGKDTAAAKGAYRLGLLQIWDQKYNEAAKTLASLSDNRSADDYRSRVVYWRYFCAKQTGDVATRDKMKEVLAKDYHLTLHGLITVGPKPTDNRPSVIFRSVSHPELNPAVRVAEALLAEGDSREAVAALEPLLDELPTAEPAFQLYVGLVLMRTGDSVHKFKLLTGLYRDYPGLISRESLEMLFPLSGFEMVRHYETTADPYLMISLIRQESAFNEHAHSPVGAMGLMQLMPGTARRMERISRNSLYDPNVNIRLGTRFFSRLSTRYGGEAELALAAYNAGPENVDTWQARYPVSNRLLFVDLIPFRETREYVASIARNYFWYKKLYESSPTTAASVPSGAGAPALIPAATERLPSASPEKFTFFKLFDS